MTLAKYQARCGHRAIVLVRRRLDPFGFAEAYEGARYVFPDRAATVNALALLLSLAHDVVHVHGADEVAYSVKLVNRRARVVLHYHGTRIRGRWRERRKFWRAADLILVSTPDLLEGAPDGVVYVPNPVDTELFRPLVPPEEREPRGLLIVKWGRRHQFRHLKPVADELASRYGIEYDVHFSDLEPIRYLDMPKVLNRYEWFIDLHHGWGEEDRVLGFLSLTGLQALACGCKVIAPWSDRCLVGLPEEHRPERVAERVLEVYRELLE